MGSYYILLGIILLFLKEWPVSIGGFASIIPASVVVVLSPTWRKYTESIKDIKNKL